MPDTRSRQRIDHLAETEALPQTVANAQNRDAATPTLDPNKANAPDIETPFADTSHPRARTRKTHTKHDSNVQVVRHPGNRKVGTWYRGHTPLFPVVERGFVVLPNRWIIERTNAWNDRLRRLKRDHDRDLVVSEAWIWLADGHRLLGPVTTEIPQHA